MKLYIIVMAKFSSSFPFCLPPFSTKVEAEGANEKIFLRAIPLVGRLFWIPFQQFTINSNLHRNLHKKFMETRNCEFNIYCFPFSHVCHWFVNWIFLKRKLFLQRLFKIKGSIKLPPGTNR